MSATVEANAKAHDTRTPGQPWTVDQLAAFLHITGRHVRRMKAAGQIKTITIGRRVLVPDVEAQRLATEGL